MSIDATFSPATFPSLRRNAPSVDDLRTRASGHAAGYAAGLRGAADDVAAEEATRDAALAQAIADGEARVAAAVAVLSAASDALNRRTVPVIAEVQDALAATAIELAAAIVGRELSSDAASASSALHRALSGVDTALVQLVRMNPADLANIDQETILATGVTFVPDATLGSGDAVTEFADGYLDARVSSALERARTAILEEGP
ncbi:MAG: FliH/SctL family protein [Homoserinimonas sp.]